jgi:hypothetical protein
VSEWVGWFAQHNALHSRIPKRLESSHADDAIQITYSRPSLFYALFLSSGAIPAHNMQSRRFGVGLLTFSKPKRRAIYGQDTSIDGMLFASVRGPPMLGGAIKSFGDKDALRLEGMQQTATISTFGAPLECQALGGAEVLANSTWAAIQGRKLPHGRHVCRFALIERVNANPTMTHPTRRSQKRLAHCILQ